MSESLTGNFLVSGPIQNPLPANGTWDGGARQGVLLCLFSCLPHASNPTAARGSQEESWTLTLGGVGSHLHGAPRLHTTFTHSPQNSPGRKQGLHLTDEEMEAQGLAQGHLAK